MKLHLCQLVVCSLLCVISVTLAEESEDVVFAEVKSTGGVGMVPIGEVKDVPLSDGTVGGGVKVSELDTGGVSAGLYAALKQLGEDPSAFMSTQADAEGGEQQMVDFTKIHERISPERLAEITEVFDWLQSNLPPDDASRMKNISARMNATVDYFHANGGRLNAADESDLMYDLQLLTDMLPQVDNAADFIKMGGFSTVLQFLDFNQKSQAKNTDTAENGAIDSGSKTAQFSTAIQTQAALLLGTTMQNNAMAFAECLNNDIDAIGVVLGKLSTELQYFDEQIVGQQLANCSPMAAPTIEAHSLLFVRLTFALSSMCRQTAVGLKRMADAKHSGLLLKWWHSLKTAIDAVSELSSAIECSVWKEYKQLFERMQMKLLTFVSDVISLNESDSDLEPLAMAAFATEEWCKRVAEVMTAEIHSDNGIRYFDSLANAKTAGRFKQDSEVCLNQAVAALTAISNEKSDDEYRLEQIIEATQLLSKLQ